jgi:GntR family transcriptional repressor for pyruvate dehydrogenase complex
MKDADNSLFQRIQQTPNLTSGLVDSLVSQIESGQLAPGQRLPTEQAIVAATGVSRTVVREALASLRARGLITTRQGLGAFVAQDGGPRSFTIDGQERLSNTLQILELRLGVETEAAALAALRRTDAEVVALRQAMEAASAAIMNSQPGVEEDFLFHRTILVATHNAYYPRVFDVIGSAVIPHQGVRLEDMTEAERLHYMQRPHKEHEAIVTAIAEGDADAAKAAIRKHLTRAYNRFKAEGVVGEPVVL